ncbi:hypothetical protein Y013_25725 (plasmid) [Rhodococcus pyridinivorans SB3094]|uniref:Uncharacterized protein n=1 Tax=Rhodococcus pyridinivorans SB3094 TaxID=1435356 RepID=V9XLK3_9NOCA|nr:hypothetical protein Y013_25725 [Rhodococcus pyridinivorans SB3094]
MQHARLVRVRLLALRNKVFDGPLALRSRTASKVSFECSA